MRPGGIMETGRTVLDLMSALGTTTRSVSVCTVMETLFSSGMTPARARLFLRMMEVS